MARFIKKGKSKIGTAPGALIFVGTQRIENIVIEAVVYGIESFTQFEKLTSQEAFNLVKDDVVVWINVVGLHDTSVIAEFGTLFGLHPLLQEDILSTDQRPKFIPEDQHLAFILKMLKVHEEKKTVHTEQISIVAGKNYLISFQEDRDDVFDPIRQRIIQPTTKIRHRKSDYLAFALMDAIVDNYILAIEYLGNEIENLEDELSETFSTLQLYRINGFKKEINNLRRIIRPVIELASQFIKSESPLISPNTIPFIKDLEDHILQASDAIEIYKELLNDELNTYHNSMSNRLNDVMRVLTVFSVVFIPLTFIAGVYGANFQYMPELGFKYSYPIFWGVLILVASGMIFYFYKKKWL